MSARQSLKRDLEIDDKRERPSSHRILRLREVERRTGRRRSSIYQDMSVGTFPRPVPLGERARGWVEKEIEEWIDSRIAKRDQADGVSRE